MGDYVAGHFERLAAETRLWRDTWYDSTLPYWFLDRTFLNTSILATSTSYRLANGRFYGWEGVGNCQGTCGHVLSDMLMPSRGCFPSWSEICASEWTFGLAQMPDGAIHFRGEFNDIPAIDAQSRLRAARTARAPDVRRRSLPSPQLAQIRLAMQWLIDKDENGDGLIESNQHNTLDTDWYGKVSWLSGLYLAALAAAEQMAEEAGDTQFAGICKPISLPAARISWTTL